MKWKERIMNEYENNRKGNQMEHEGAKTISESLKINTSLTELNLESVEKIRYSEE